MGWIILRDIPPGQVTLDLLRYPVPGGDMLLLEFQSTFARIVLEDDSGARARFAGILARHAADAALVAAHPAYFAAFADSLRAMRQLVPALVAPPAGNETPAFLP